MDRLLPNLEATLIKVAFYDGLVKGLLIGLVIGICYALWLNTRKS